MKKAFVAVISGALFAFMPMSAFASTSVPFNYNLAPVSVEGDVTTAVSDSFSGVNIQDIQYWYTCENNGTGIEEVVLQRQDGDRWIDVSSIQTDMRGYIEGLVGWISEPYGQPFVSGANYRLVQKNYSTQYPLNCQTHIEVID